MMEFLLLCHTYYGLVFYALVIFTIFAEPVYHVCVYTFFIHSRIYDMILLFD